MKKEASDKLPFLGYCEIRILQYFQSLNDSFIAVKQSLKLGAPNICHNEQNYSNNHKYHNTHYIIKIITENIIITKVIIIFYTYSLNLSEPV